MPPSSRAASAPASSRSCAGLKALAATQDPRRTLLLELLHAALRRVDGRRCVREALSAQPLGAGAVWVCALGKAAAAMAQGAHEAAGAAIARTLIITRDAESCAALAGSPGTEVLIGGHPVPDERSLAAGAHLLAWIAALPQDAQPLFLISGGASSLVEVLSPGVTLEALRALNRAGLEEGIAIGEFNARRVGLSAIKGGRLAQRLQGRSGRALFLSDVPGDDPAVIGSGVLGPAPQGADRIERTLLASIDDAVAAAAACAAGYGLTVHAPRHRFADSAVRVAARCAHELSLQPAQVCVWGGESTVALPPQPGRGGRNQHLALAAARLIAGHPELLLLAVGTDGSDGVTEDAGALVDADTCARVALAELDADTCLERADAARALAASGDLVHTGPTGTNVGDLVIGLKVAPGAAAALPGARGGAHARVL
jgi:hydroxypyruvate reductase